MKRAEDGGLLSILAAIAAALASAGAKALIARRSRAPIEAEEHTMCRNHSHMAGRIFSVQDQGDVTEARMLVTQDLTLETSSGLKLKLPPYCVCSVRLAQRNASLASELRAMAAQGAVVSFRDGEVTTSGLIIPRK